LGLIGLTPLAGGSIGLGLVSIRNHRAAAGVFGASATAFATLVFALGAQQVDRHQTSEVLLDAIAANSPNPQVASYKILEPSWVFYGGAPIVELHSPAPSEGDLTSRKPSVLEFFGSQPEGVLITTGRRLAEIETVLPPDVMVLARTPRFLKDDELFLLGRTHQPIGMAATYGNPGSY
jgi:hypothetical protein